MKALSITWTPGRQRIYRALCLGHEVYITEDSRAVDRITGEEYGNQIAALEVMHAGAARWRRGCAWVMELNPRAECRLGFFDVALTA